jgi:UDP-N-acetylglucosamine:LPS N-acetylglucosamine transferase
LGSHQRIGVVALTTAEVVQSVRRIVENSERLATMRAQLTNIAPRGSSRRIAELIAQVAEDGRSSPRRASPFPPQCDRA